MSKEKRRRQALARAIYILGPDHPSVRRWYAAMYWRQVLPGTLHRKVAGR